MLCKRCGKAHGHTPYGIVEGCKAVKTVEYYEGGGIKRIEFHDAEQTIEVMRNLPGVVAGLLNMAGVQEGGDHETI